MIRFEHPTTWAPLSAAEQAAVETLVDLSRVLPVESDAALDVACVRLVDRPAAADLPGARAAGWYVEIADGTVLVPRQLLTLAADLLGAAEQRATRFDRFGRVDPVENPLVAAGLEREPVVAQMAAAIRTAAVAAAGRRPVRLVAPWPDGKRWAAALTHDLDVVAMWPVFTAMRVAELARKADLRRVTQVVGAALQRIGGNPVWEAVRDILDAERAAGVRSTWFVLCGTPTLATRRAGDLTYEPESAAARRIIDAVASDGHEIGLHGSFETFDDDSRFRPQRDRLAALTKVEANGVRQHYLRMRPVATQLAMGRAGFTYDSTFGFADRNGFRFGVGDVVRVAGDEGDSASIDEVPFVWMDRALSKYRGVENPDAWIDDAIDLAGVCRSAEGLWVGIWHPNLSPALGFPAAPAAYESLIKRLLQLDPYVATVGSIVAWRRARRAARATGLRSDGSVVLRAHAGFPIRLEDATGQPTPESAARP